MFLDARGKVCPIPVVMARKELDGGCEDLTVAVDNDTAVQNLTRLAVSRQMTAESQEKDGAFYVHIYGEADALAPAPPLETCGFSEGRLCRPCGQGPPGGGSARAGL